MKMKNKYLYRIACLLLISGSCSIAPKENIKPDATQTVVVIPTQSQIPNSSTIAATLTVTDDLKATPSFTPLPIISDMSICWDSVWAGEIDYGLISNLAEGESNSLWILLDNALIRLSDDGTEMVIDFREILGCEECGDIVNGTLAITSTGSAWVGLTTGLLIVDKNGKSNIIETNAILHPNSDLLNLRVLLSDNNETMWVSNANSICSYNKTGWNCNSFKQLEGEIVIASTRFEEYDNIHSAATGQDGQIWFGTTRGRIIQYSDNQFSIFDLSLIGYPMTELDSMAFDHQHNTLWVITTRPPSLGEGPMDDPLGVISRNSKGEWTAYKLSLFARKQDDLRNNPLTSIATAPDGIVWLSMLYRHQLVYFDGVNWKTLGGENLPHIESGNSAFNNDSCERMDDPNIFKILPTNTGKLLVANLGGVQINNVDFWK